MSITVVGLETADGQVRVAVFDARERWLKKGTYSRLLAIDGRTCQWRIEDVPYGEYGIAAFHDRNGNGKNDRNFLGIPKEPYGFSNDARPKLRAPRWEEAAFAVGAPSTEVVVEVR